MRWRAHRCKIGSSSSVVRALEYLRRADEELLPALAACPRLLLTAPRVQLLVCAAMCRARRFFDAGQAIVSMASYTSFSFRVWRRASEMQMPCTLAKPSPRRLRQLRGAAGRRLRELREQRGLTQRGLARKLGAKFTFISQIEHGRCRIPPRRYLAWAVALEVDPSAFARELLAYYDPEFYNVIFHGNTDLNGAATPNS